MDNLISGWVRMRRPRRAGGIVNNAG